MCITHKIAYWIILFLSCMSISAFSQITGELQLANEYFRSGEYKKAKILYEELMKDKSKNDFIYDNYLTTLEKLNEYELAIKFVKKNIKKYEQSPKYKIDHYLLLKKQNKAQEAEKQKERYTDQISEDRNQIFDAYSLLSDKGEHAFIVSLLLKARMRMKEPTLFAEQLASAYKELGNKEAMIGEMINMVKYEAHDQELLKNKLQPLLDNDQDLEILQKLLITNIQKNPEDEESTVLLIWVLMQRKEFNLALLQAKAYDKRKRLGGEQIYQLAKIAFDNNDHETVIEASEYVQSMYVGSDMSFMISMLSLRSKEELLKRTYPIDKVKVHALLADYKALCEKKSATPYCIESIRKQALLMAFYLNKKDSAIVLLENLIKSNPYDRNAVDRVKLDLGDLYLLRNEHWESVLLYAQVVKTQKENPLGHEAKFKNAKVHYYKGEFDLA
ncbi:MAG TPA: hypothetical protein VL947_01940, partial [Cytophagales bacterium]|nr:hypothetical protein [Cytophagales bacterium]